MAPTNGFSLVNSDNTSKCILPGTNINSVNTADNRNLIISSNVTSLSSTTNYTLGGLIVNNDTTAYGNSYVGTLANPKTITLQGNFYFGDPATPGISIDQKISRSIGNRFNPIAPIQWYLDTLHPSKLT